MTGHVMSQRKRILFVENGIGYGGAIICLRHLVRNLDRTRFEPMVLTGRGGPLYADIANDAPWRCIPDRLIDIPAIRLRMDSRPVLGQKSLPARFVNQVLSRVDDLVNFLPCLLRTLALMLRWKPALVHLNNEPLCNRAALVAAWMLRIPVVCHVRGEQRGSRLMHWLFRLPAKFIAVSNWIAEDVEKLGVPQERIQRIYDGIELEKLDRTADGLAMRRTWGVSPEAFTVGLVGMLIPWKGQRLFLEAARRLLKDNPDVVLLMVGGTPGEYTEYESELRALASTEEFSGRVVFTGHVSDMSAAYNALDIVVSASTSPEPLGIVVIESMALGRAVVAPAHGGALEIVEHERTGLLFTPGDSDSLAKEILRFHDSATLRQNIGRAAREKTLEAFAVARHASLVECTFDELLMSR